MNKAQYQKRLAGARGGMSPGCRFVSFLVLICLFSVHARAQIGGTRWTQLCFKFWTPGNITIEQLYHVYHGAAPPPSSCPDITHFNNDFFDEMEGRTYRLITGPGRPPRPWDPLTTTNEIVTSQASELSGLRIGSSADIRFEGFELELGNQVQNFGTWYHLSAHDIVPFEGGTPHLINAGQFIKPTNSGLTVIAIPFTDQWGTIRVDPKASLHFSDPETELVNTTLSGSGQVTFTHGARFSNVTNTGPTLRLTGGTFGGQFTFDTIWDGTNLAIWPRGQPFVANESNMMITAGTSLTIEPQTLLINRGGIHLAGGNSQLSYRTTTGHLARILNQGIIRKRADAPTNRIGTVSIANYGQLEIDGRDRITEIDSEWIDYDGSILVPSGVLEFRGLNSQFLGTTFRGAGTVRLAAGGHLHQIKSLGTSLELTGGRLTGTNHCPSRWIGGDATQFINESQLTLAPSGSQPLYNLGSFVNRGRLDGAGSLKIAVGYFYNEGTLVPDPGPDGIQIEGPTSLLDWGTLELQIGGRALGQWSRFGSLSLHFGGHLRVLLRDGFVPEVGDQFALLAVQTTSGYFKSMELPELGPNRVWDTRTLQTDGIIRVIPTPANLEDWRAVHFTQTEITDPTLSGDNADPDGDGIGNLLEFLLGTAPRINQPIANRAALPRPSLDRLSDGARLVLDFTLPNSLPSHAIVGIEATDSLGSPSWLPIASVDGSGNWQGTAEVTTGAAGPDRRSVRVRDSRPNTDAARFYRVFGGGR